MSEKLTKALKDLNESLEDMRLSIEEGYYDMLLDSVCDASRLVGFIEAAILHEKLSSSDVRKDN